MRAPWIVGSRGRNSGLGATRTGGGGLRGRSPPAGTSGTRRNATSSKAQRAGSGKPQPPNRASGWGDAPCGTAGQVACASQPSLPTAGAFEHASFI